MYRGGEAQRTDPAVRLAVEQGIAERYALVLDYAAADSPTRKAQLTRLADYRPPSWEDHFTVINDWLLQL